MLIQSPKNYFLYIKYIYKYNALQQKIQNINIKDTDILDFIIIIQDLAIFLNLTDILLLKYI